MEHSRVLVTGGAGFIGSNLVGELLCNGNEVICLDNFSTGRRDNIACYMGLKPFTLFEGDIRETVVCEKAMDGVEYVFHEAALGSVPRSISDPCTSTDVNVTGFANILMAAKKCGVKRVVYASSSSVYGDSANSPKVERIIGRPISPYALTKRVNEEYAELFATVYGVESVGLRYFNVFGPRQTPYSTYAAVIPKFALELMSHRSPVINGDGGIARDFTYISNVIQANQLAAMSADPRVANTVFNVACGFQTSVNEVFHALRAELAKFDQGISAIDAVHGPERKGDVPFSLADVSKARELLGYCSLHDFRQGLALASEWYWHNLKK